ncbi:MAG: hypothetical protein JST93_24790 [Acidobacteria bacterium]|nr:hypothetical protein [Acidobacteriota bacterium]
MPLPKWALSLIAFGLSGARANAQYTIRTLAGDGPPDGISASAFALGVPTAVFAAPNGDIYFASPTRNKVFKISSTGTVTTVAGNGGSGFSGDGGPAISATLSDPFDVTLDNVGNLYIADTSNNRIRKVSPNGVITTIAGAGMNGDSGDGGPASNAWIFFPAALKFDSVGNLYFAESFRIRRITPDGRIFTVAGTGAFGYSGDGGLASNATLGKVTSLAFDSAGNLFLADSSNQRVRKINPAGIITTFAGNGVAAFQGDGGPAASASVSNPYGVVVDSLDNLYIADSFNHRVRKVTPAGIITTVASISTPEGVAVDNQGNLLVLENGVYLRAISPAGVISTVAGNGTRGLSGDTGLATSAQLFAPQGLAVDASGGIFVSDGANDRVRRIHTDGRIFPSAGGGISIADGQPATSALLSIPFGAAADGAGNLYIADAGHSIVRKVTPAGIISTIAGSLQRGYSGDGGPAALARFDSLWDLALDNAGNLFITDGPRLRKISPSGIITTVAGNGSLGYSSDGVPAISASINAIVSVAPDNAGNLFISDSTTHRIRKISTDGMLTTVAGNGAPAFSGDGGLATRASLAHPQGIAVDAQGNIYIADTGNHRIRKVLPDGVITTIAGSSLGFSGDNGPAHAAQLNSPARLAVDRNGNILISDTRNNRIRILSPSLTAQPVSLAFQYTPAAGSPPAQTLTVTSNPLNVTASAITASGLTWLSVNQVALQPPSFLVAVNPAGLASGLHTGFIRLSSAGVHTDVFVSFTIAGNPGCAYTIVPSTLTVPATVTAAAFTINVNPGCPWTAVPTAPWISLTSSSTGDSTATVTLQLQPNTGPGRTGTVNVAGQTFTITQTSSANLNTGLRFVPLVPCRIIDTRPNSIFAANETRAINLPSSNCSVPAAAAAYSLNVTIVPTGPLGYLSLWPTGQPRPLVSTLNSFDGRIKANAAIVPAGTGGSINVFVTDATHVILDINGYFTADAGSSFYPTPPCRVIDTRPFSGLAANQSRTINVTASPCAIPPTATAYSLNITAIPTNATLGFLTTWPTGQPQPFVSTLNSPNGTIVANAAIVPAGVNGSINAYVTNSIELIVDINGYFAPPGGANARTFNTVTPCRIIDTRPNAIQPAGETRSIVVPSSPCGIPATAKAYSLNATVVPTGLLAYITLWPSDLPQPHVSTLNDYDGIVVSNAAIVPAAANGSISAFVTDTTHLILDINGYFQ